MTTSPAAKIVCALAAAALWAAPGARAATYRLDYEVQPQIVGTTSSTPTGTIYDAASGYSGVVELLVTQTGGTSRCSGALIAGGWTVLTAGHCLSPSGGGSSASRVQVVFHADSGSTTVYDSSTLSMNYVVYPGWSGNWEEGGDLALIKLPLAAPSWAQSYSLYTGSDEIGQSFNVAGYGRTGEGATGDTGVSGSLRQGSNVWDGTLADMVAGGLEGAPARPDILLSDFDNGLLANDGWLYFFGRYYASVGAAEAATAPGDSGGPSFINGYIAGVTSFGMRLDYSDGSTSDVDSTYNSSFGEFSGMTRVSSYYGWLGDNMVPEPSSFALAGLGLLALGWLRSRRVR